MAPPIRWQPLVALGLASGLITQGCTDASGREGETQTGGDAQTTTTPTEGATGPLSCGDAGVQACRDAGYDYYVCLRGFCDFEPRGPCIRGGCSEGLACANDVVAHCDGCTETVACVQEALCPMFSTPDWVCAGDVQSAIDGGASDDSGAS